MQKAARVEHSKLFMLILRHSSSHWIDSTVTFFSVTFTHVYGNIQSDNVYFTSFNICNSHTPEDLSQDIRKWKQVAFPLTPKQPQAF